MKKYTKTIISFSIFFSLLALNLHAQNIQKNSTNDFEQIAEYEQVFLNAKNLQDKQCYKEAVTEYKRYIFLQDYAPLKNLTEAYKQVAIYYLVNKEYNIAFDYIEKGINNVTENENNQEELNNLYILDLQTISLDATQNKKWLISNPKLNAYLNFEKYQDSIKQFAYFILIKNDIENWEWENAKNHFDTMCLKYPSIYSQEQIDTFNQTIEKQKKQKYKNVKVAAFLSIIPGLGQMYSHNYKDALNSFLLNGSLIASCIFSAISSNYIDLILIEGRFLIRFYSGNFYNSQKETLIYNNNINLEYEKTLIDLISSSKLNYETDFRLEKN